MTPQPFSFIPARLQGGTTACMEVLLLTRFAGKYIPIWAFWNHSLVSKRYSNECSGQEEGRVPWFGGAVGDENRLR
jgi:hypothetical protein